MSPLTSENAVWSSLKRALQNELWHTIKLADKSTIGIPDAVALKAFGFIWWIEIKFRRKKNVLHQLSPTQAAMINTLRIRGCHADVVYYEPRSEEPWRIVVQFKWSRDKDHQAIEEELSFSSARELVKAKHEIMLSGLNPPCLTVKTDGDWF